MIPPSYGRAPINELVTLLKTVNPNAVEKLSHQFPQFRNEFDKGPSAGPAENDRKYYADRAKLADALASAAVEGVNEHADRIIQRFLSMQHAKTIIAVVGALGGVSVLTSVGLSNVDALRISGIFTSMIAVLNAGMDVMTKRYSADSAKKALEAKQDALTLTFHQKELALMVASERELADIVDAIEECNESARKLNEKKGQILLV